MRDSTKMMVVVGLIFVVVLALLATAFITHASLTTPSTPITQSAQTTQPTNPNHIDGLSVQASDYQIFITYTPEPGAKIMRVSYVDYTSHGYFVVGESFDFPVFGDPISTTLQRSVGDKMRVTIIYDNNVIKYTEFET